MDSAVGHLHARATILQGQIATALELQRKSGIDLGGLVATYQSLLASMYGDDFPLASLTDNSDVIFHAEGPSARHHAAASGVVAWLCEEADRRLKQLTSAAMHWSGSTGDAAGHDLKVLMNGVAPGSLYIGFSIDSAARMAQEESGDPALPLEGGVDVLGQARTAIANLVLVPRFVDDESINAGFAEAVQDPSLRDATLMAAYHLSPTGKRGIHTLEISTPRRSEPAAAFTNRERVVLRETAVRRPMLRRARHGSFVGELREIDLDAHRFQLRGVPTVGTLRCALDGLTAELARKHIGKGVTVSGEYEVDADGKPRLMLVDKIAPYQRQKKLIR